MTEPERTIDWETTALRYLDALDAGDAAALAELWEQAAINPRLEQVLVELTDGLADEEAFDPAWQADAESVRSLVREHLSSGLPSEDDLPRLTVREVASQLQKESVIGKRFTASDQVANSRLLAETTPLPDELGLPSFEKWKTSLDISASAQYWRAFRQAAVLLAMGRCQRAGELAAARRAGRTPKGGRS